MQKSSFLNILRAIRSGRCRERRYADHIFSQIYFRMHHFVVKFSKFARRHWPPNQNPADPPASTRCDFFSTTTRGIRLRREVHVFFRRRWTLSWWVVQKYDFCDIQYVSGHCGIFRAAQFSPSSANRRACVGSAATEWRSLAVRPARWCLHTPHCSSLCAATSSRSSETLSCTSIFRSTTPSACTSTSRSGRRSLRVSIMLVHFVTRLSSLDK